MEPKLLILFSHELTDSQKQDIRYNLKIKESLIIQLSPDLKEKFSNVPAELKSICDFSQEFIEWIGSNGNPGDYVLIQGDYGVTFYLVDFCLKNHYIPLYATTERVQQEVQNPDGRVIIKRFFEHKHFRRFEAWEK